MLLNVNDHKIKLDLEHRQDTLYYAGETLCYMGVDDGDIRLGRARCSLSDRYNRRIGRKLALLRAMQAHPLTRDDKSLRKAIWDEFFKMCKR